MLRWAIVFLVIALIAGALGLSGVAGTSSNIAWILFVVFLILMVVSFIFGGLRGRGECLRSNRRGRHFKKSMLSNQTAGRRNRRPAVFLSSPL